MFSELVGGERGLLSLALAAAMMRDMVLVTGFVNQSFPQPLDKEEEQACFERWRKYQDKAAHDLLVEHNLRLVAHVANVSATQSRHRLGLCQLHHWASNEHINRIIRGVNEAFVHKATDHLAANRKRNPLIAR